MGLALSPNTMRRLVALVLALSCVGSTALSAQKPKKQKGKSKKETHVTVVFVDTQREAARSYFARGTAKATAPRASPKNNGCLPPGQAKKRYVIGRSLPHGIVVGELPVELYLATTAPAGYRYGILDGDLVKLAVGTMLVVDAIEGLVR